MQKTISMMVGKGSISHNNRKFTAKNVIAERTSENIIYVQDNLREVYHELFDKALERYNAKQKRSDRKIDDYYEKIRQGRQEKLFHELIVQVGNREDSGYGKRDSFEAIWSLEDYMEGFQQRNPNLRVFNAVLHMDEATPHLHIDFVPFSTGNTRGLETKVSFKGAMKAQGFVGTGRQDTEWNRWVRHEKECLAEIMEKYHVEWLQKGTHEKHLSVYDFEKKMRKAEVEELEQTISGQEKKIGEQESALLTNESVLKNQSLQIKENEENEREMLQRLKDAKEDVRDAESRIDSARTDYEDWKHLADSAYERYKMYQSWGDDEKKSYDEITDKKEELQKEVADLEQRKGSQNAEISSGEKELAHIRQEMVDTQEQMETYLMQAQEQYERYAKVAPTQRESQMFEDILQLRQENEELKWENRTLRQKLQKAYDFMRQFTINGRNMLERFLESIGEKVQRFVGSIGSRR